MSTLRTRMFRNPRPVRERLRLDGVGAFFLRVLDAVAPSVSSLGAHGGRPTLGTGGLVRQMMDTRGTRDRSADLHTRAQTALSEFDRRKPDGGYGEEVLIVIEEIKEVLRVCEIVRTTGRFGLFLSLFRLQHFFSEAESLLTLSGSKLQKLRRDEELEAIRSVSSEVREILIYGPLILIVLLFIVFLLSFISCAMILLFLLK